MKKARAQLEDLGFIKTELIEERNQEHIYSYELVEGMALTYSTPERQDMTVEVSDLDSPYIEEKNASPESGDVKEPRTPRQLPEGRGNILEHMLADISVLYSQHHPKHLPMPNRSSVRTVLKNFLLENEDWPEDVLIEGVRNYYRSVNTNKAKSPEKWIRNIPEFSTGPLDQYGHVRPDINRWEDVVVKPEQMPSPEVEVVRPIGHKLAPKTEFTAGEVPW